MTKKKSVKKSTDRERRLVVLQTDTERNALDRAAKRLEMSTSAFVRMLLKAELKRTVKRCR